MSCSSCAVSYIYTLNDPFTKQVRYVGQSVDPKVRFKQHLRDKSVNHKTNWINKLKRLGSTPIQKVIFCGDFENITREEEFWINFYREEGNVLTNVVSAEDTLGTNYIRKQLLEKNGTIGVHQNPNSKRWVTVYKGKFIASFKSKEVALKVYDCLARYYEDQPVTNFPGVNTFSINKAKTISKKVINKTFYGSHYSGVSWNSELKRFRIFLLDKSSKNIYVACFEDYDKAVFYRDSAAKSLGLKTVKHHEAEPLTIKEIRSISKKLHPIKRSKYSSYIGLSYNKRDERFIAFVNLDTYSFIGSFENEKEAALWHDRVAAYYGLDVNDTPDFTCSLEDARTKIQQERNKNGYIGVNQTKSGKYSASIVLDRKTEYLGSFDTPEEAAYYADATRNFYNLTNNQTTEDKLSLEEARLKIAQQTTPKGIRFSGTNWIIRINVEKKEYNFGGIPTKEEAIYISDALRNYYGLRNSGTTQDKLSMEEVLAKYPQKPHDKNKVKKEKLFEGISQAEFIKQTTGRVGITWLKREKKWQAKIYIEGKCHLLGTYPEDELETAQFVYDSVANYYFMGENPGARNSPENTGLMTIEEAKNFSKELNRKTEYIGIRPYKDISYQAFITLDNKQHRIGTFRDLKQAIYYTDAVRNHYNKKSNNSTTDKLSLEDAKLKIKQLN